MQTLRAQLRPHGAGIRVVKNKLAAIAADNVGLGDLRATLTGPIALVTSTGDPVASSKVISDFAKISRILQIKLGVLEGQDHCSGRYRESRESSAAKILLARVVGGVQAPLSASSAYFPAPIRSFAYVLAGTR